MPSEEFNIRQLYKDLKETLLGVDNGNVISALGYIPFLGWALPYYFRKGQQFCQFHAMQAIKLNVGIVFISLFVWFLRDFPVIGWISRITGINPIVTDFISFASWIAFFIYSGWGAWKAYHEEEYVLLYLSEIERLLRKALAKAKTPKG